MRTRGERRYLTKRAVKRKWSRYLNTFSGLVDGMYPSSVGFWRSVGMYPDPCIPGAMYERRRFFMTGVEWRPIHKHLHQPHRMHKSTIDNSPEYWPGRRHNMNWDAPDPSEWEDEYIAHDTWSHRCGCDTCTYERLLEDYL